MRIPSFEDEYLDNYHNMERANELFEVLEALVQLKMIKKVDPKFHEENKEALWSIALSVVQKHKPHLANQYDFYREFSNTPKELVEDYRRHYERFFGQGN